MLGINVARATAMSIGRRSVMTAIRKRAVEGDVAVQLGPARPATSRPTAVHGGLAKAVYAYPVEHYAVWRTLRAQARGRLGAETAPAARWARTSRCTGLLETDALIGDLLRFPRLRAGGQRAALSVLQVQAAMGFAQAAKMMVQSAHLRLVPRGARAGTDRAAKRSSSCPDRAK